MKLSANTLGIITFTAIATTAFAWMAKRPAIEGQIIQFGMPLQADNTTENTKDAMPTDGSQSADGSQSTDNSQPTDSSDQANNPEPEKATEDSSNKNKEKAKKK